MPSRASWTLLFNYNIILSDFQLMSTIWLFYVSYWYTIDVIMFHLTTHVFFCHRIALLLYNKLSASVGGNLGGIRQTL